MSWAVGKDKSGAWIGYGVPAWCDEPGCSKVIDRGIAHRCGGEDPDSGCGLHFCKEHLHYAWTEVEARGYATINELCRCCVDEVEPYGRKRDHPEWVSHMLTDPSWEQWRNENPGESAELVRRAEAGDGV